MMNFNNLAMIGDQFRKNESTFSPKSSPHGGGRSPVVSRQDSSGTLKTTISLGKTPTIIQTGPFYSMKEPPGKGELTGDKDLMTEYGLHHTLTKFKDKKVKESLASFLPNLPGIYDGVGNLENSTLRSIIDKPPIGGKELLPLSTVQLAGFRLHPGPLPEQYRNLSTTPPRKHKNKKKSKHKDGTVPPETTLMDSNNLETYEKKHKKQKRHEDEKERKKRKKEKKRKKKSHSPEPTGGLGVTMLGGGGNLVGSGGLMAGLNSLSSLGVGHQPNNGLMSMSPVQMQTLPLTAPAHQQQHQMQHQHMLQSSPLGGLGSSASLAGLSAVMGSGAAMTPGGGASAGMSGGVGTGGPGGLMLTQQTSLF